MIDFTAQQIVVTGGDGALGSVVVAYLSERGGTCHVPDFDLTNEAETRRFFEELPPLAASIHCAGGFAMAPIEETSLADFERMHAINAVTCFVACREAVRSMRRGGAGGRIVNVISRAALAPSGGSIAYTAAKAEVAAITQALAAEVRADGILVNAIAPSIIDTPANRAAMPTADHAAWPRPRELAESIAFLASRANTVTSGALVPVYGRA